MSPLLFHDIISFYNIISLLYNVNTLVHYSQSGGFGGDFLIDLMTYVHGFIDLMTAVHGFIDLMTAVHGFIDLMTALHGFIDLMTAVHGFIDLITAVHGFIVLLLFYALDC